jgi:hypothetical protein
MRAGLGLADRRFWLRPQAMGFWTMVLLCWPVMLLFSSNKSPDWLLALVLFIVSISAWTIALAYFGLRTPLPLPYEKIEFAAFWTTLLSSFVILISASILVSIIAYSILLIDGIGFLIYCILHFYNTSNTRAKMTYQKGI